MKTSLVLAALMIVGVATIRSAFGDDWKNESGQEWWRRGEWKEEFWDGPCRVKIEAKRREYQKEVKCERNN